MDIYDYSKESKLLGYTSWEERLKWYADKYESGMSANEIAEWLKKNGVRLTARQIARLAAQGGAKIRGRKECFRNAMDRGRVTFHWKKISENKRRTLPPKLRMEILKRDEYKCRICGSGDFLEIDHIKAIVFGGDNSKENLRVLCHECNMGKRFLEQEQIGKHEWKKKDSEMRRGKKLG